ncbi:hypothetical protein GCM10009813_23860 [Brevibacterium marinum]
MIETPAVSETVVMTLAMAPDRPPAWGMARLSAPSTADSDHRMTRWSQLWRSPTMRWRKTRARIDVTVHGHTRPRESAVRMIPAADEATPTTIAAIGCLTARTRATLWARTTIIAMTVDVSYSAAVTGHPTATRTTPVKTDSSQNHPSVFTRVMT